MDESVEPDSPEELDADIARRELEELRFARMRIELEPDDPMGHLELGLLLLHYGKIEGADDAFEHVLAIEPGEPNARYWRALIADSWGQTDHALKELTNLARRFPHAGDRIFPPLEVMIDKVVRRIHAPFAIATGFAASFTAMSPSRSPMIVAIVIGLLLVAIVAAFVRSTTTWRRLGGRSFRSLLRMILRRDAVLRVAVSLDVVAWVAVVVALVTPYAAARAIGLSAIGLLVIATVLQAFTSRVTPIPEGG